MSISEPRLRLLLRQAKKVAASGKRAAAEQLYRQITEEAPESVDAWLGLAAVTDHQPDRMMAYERALELSPDNQQALAGIALIKGEPTQTTVAPETESEHPNGPREQTGERFALAPTPMQKPPIEEEKPGVSPAAETVTDAFAFNRQLERVRDVEDQDEALHAGVCYRHPYRETSLRCYSCDRPICSECAVKTPVGYRCPTCIRESEDVFYNARMMDYPLAVLVSFPLSLVAGYLVLRFASGFGFFLIIIMIFVGGAVGGFIGRITKQAIGRRRGRYLPQVVATIVVLGVALPVLVLVMLVGSVPLTALLVPGIYLFTAASSAFYQMK